MGKESEWRDGVAGTNIFEQTISQIRYVACFNLGWRVCGDNDVMRKGIKVTRTNRNALACWNGKKRCVVVYCGDREDRAGIDDVEEEEKLNGCSGKENL